MLPCLVILPLQVQTPPLIEKVALNTGLRTSASPAFPVTCALPKLEDLQPSHSNPLVHSLEKHGGVPYTVPIWNSTRTRRHSATRPLLLFWTSNKSSTARPCPL